MGPFFSWPDGPVDSVNSVHNRLQALCRVLAFGKVHDFYWIGIKTLIHMYLTDTHIVDYYSFLIQQKCWLENNYLIQQNC